MVWSSTDPSSVACGAEEPGYGVPRDRVGLSLRPKIMRLLQGRQVYGTYNLPGHETPALKDQWVPFSSMLQVSIVDQLVRCMPTGCTCCRLFPMKEEETIGAS